MDHTNFEQRLNRIEDLLISQKTVLTFQEVAVYTGLSKSHLYKLTSTGGIPCYKPTGKRIYFEREEVEQWLLRNKKRSQNEIDDEAEIFIMKKRT